MFRVKVFAAGRSRTSVSSLLIKFVIRAKNYPLTDNYGRIRSGAFPHKCIKSFDKVCDTGEKLSAYI